MVRKKKNKELTKKQIDILYGCWKDADTTKDRLSLIEERIPKVSSLAALSVMRKMAKTDPKWLKMATRKKNKKEKDILEKKKKIELKKEEQRIKKIKREEKRLKRTQIIEQKTILDNIRNNLKEDHLNCIIEKLESDFFFCSSVHQFVNNISCIFRVFSNDHSLSRTPQCEKCSKFNKYIPILKEIIENGKTTAETKKGTSRNKASKGGSKNKKQKTKTSETTNRKAQNNAGC